MLDAPNARSALADFDPSTEIEDEDNVASSPLTPSRTRINLPHPDEMDRLHRWSKSKNIALEKDPKTGEYEISDTELAALGMRCHRKYEIDHNSCGEWREQTKLAMDLAMQKSVAKQYPWPKAANVIFPLMTNAAMQFAARAYPAVVQNRNVVKGVVIGRDDGIPAPMLQGPSPMGPMPPNGPAGAAPAGPLPGPAGVPPVNLPQSPNAMAMPAGPAMPGAGGAAAPPASPQNPQWLVPPGAKQARADRIGEHMSWQLLDEQPEWEPETDRLLHMLPIEGCVFRKSYFDPALGRNSSLVVSALKLVMNYKAKSLELATAITEEIEFSPNEVREKELAEVFRTITYTPEPNSDGDEDAPVVFLEQHTWWDGDNDGYKEPYIITIHKGSQQVVRIVARYTMDDIKYNATKRTIVKISPVHYYTQYDFLPNPEGGLYGVGFGQILKPVNEAINTTLNMMIDAGHLQNTGSGFIGRGLSMNAGAVRFIPGEWKQVNATGSTIKDSIVPLPFPGPSQVLFQLLGLLIESGKEVASIKDVLTGEQPANTPATTTLALIEQGLRAFTAIYKRVHRSLKAELQKLYRLNRLYLEDDVNYRIGDEWKTVTRDDYERGAGVEPISDPTMVSDMQKLGRSQFLLQFAADPMINKKEILTRAFQGANIEKIESLFNPQPPPDPKVIEAMMKLTLKDKHDNALIQREMASALLMKAQAILALTAADKNLTGIDVQWAQHQLEIVKTGLDALGNGVDMGAAADAASQAGVPSPAGVGPGSPGSTAPISGAPLPVTNAGPPGGLPQ